MSLTFTSWNFDQPSYVSGSGAAITLTIQYASSDLADGSDIVSAVTAVLSDTSGTLSQVSDTSGNFPSLITVAPGDSPDPTAVSAADSRATPGVWTLVSNSFSGGTAPFVGTAVLTSVA